jgi:proline iminopeptidase
VVLGASWGSVLGLAYAQAHPHSVKGSVLFSVASGSRLEVERATRGAGRFYPLEWQEFRDGVPDSEREGDLATAYYRLLIDPDPAVHEPAAAAWCAWDDRQMRAPEQPASARFRDPRFRLCFARLVTHYWSHGHFLKDGQLLEHASRLADIPGVLIQGRLDLNQPVDLFWHLARSWPESEFVMIDEEGHLGGKAMDDTILEATTQLASRPHRRRCPRVF